MFPWVRMGYRLPHCALTKVVAFNGASFVPQGHLTAISGDMFCCRSWGVFSVTGIYWIDPRDAVKYPTVHGTAPNNNGLSYPKCQRGKAENL